MNCTSLAIEITIQLNKNAEVGLQPMKNILIAAKSRHAFNIINSCFDSGHHIDSAETVDDVLEKLSQKPYEFLFLDSDLLNSPRTEAEFKEHFQNFWQLSPETEIVILTNQKSVQSAVKAVKAGASNYLTFPLNKSEVKHVIDIIEEYIRLYSELTYLRSQVRRGDSIAVLRTKSPEMREIYSKVRAVAVTNSTVLITGETGTGKGVIAKLIHQHSKRSEQQFISVHCGAIPDTLLESELFGHEKGAFTGAVRRKLGKFEVALGGTIFLDEIGTISAAMQIKLLQVLQEKSFQRVGGEMMLTADTRIIAATNANLNKMCEAGQFRFDLFYRLNVFPIEIPPLRERINDIPLLTELFLKKLNRLYGKNISGIRPDVLQAFQDYDWPGNIRELENVIERAYILETTPTLMLKNFPLILLKNETQSTFTAIDSSRSLAEVRSDAIAKIERNYLMEILTLHNGKIRPAAEAAGVGVRQFHKLLKKYNIHKEDYKRPKSGTANSSN